MSGITKAIAAQIEECFKQSHIEITKQYGHGKTLEVSGGAACFAGVDSYFSQVVGWGFNTSSSQVKVEIKKIETFYKLLQHNRVDIELSPFTGNALAIFLSQRGYRISELNNVSVLNLDSYVLHDIAMGDLFIKTVRDEELENWAKTVAIGFGCLEAQEQFIYYARAKGVTAFGVYQADKMIAGATVAVHGEFCDLGVTSTLPAYRRRGLQKKLITARLNYVKSQGLRWAIVTTEPGSISDLNVQKQGFHCAYTRIKMTLIN